MHVLELLCYPLFDVSCGPAVFQDHSRDAINRNGRMMIISKSGFTEELREFAEPHGVLLVGMDEIMGRRPFPSI